MYHENWSCVSKISEKSNIAGLPILSTGRLKHKPGKKKELPKRIWNVVFSSLTRLLQIHV